MTLVERIKLLSSTVETSLWIRTLECRADSSGLRDHIYVVVSGTLRNMVLDGRIGLRERRASCLEQYERRASCLEQYEILLERVASLGWRHSDYPTFELKGEVHVKRLATYTIDGKLAIPEEGRRLITEAYVQMMLLPPEADL